MRIDIDYNAEMSDGRFFARLARLSEQPSVGEMVDTRDDDRNRLVMMVDEIDDGNGLVYLRPDWSTWVDASGPRFLNGSTLHLQHGGDAPARLSNLTATTDETAPVQHISALARASLSNLTAATDDVTACVLRISAYPRVSLSNLATATDGTAAASPILVGSVPA